MGEILKKFGKRVRSLRRTKNMTQERLAEAAGLSLQSIGEIERGRGNPTLINIERLATALNVDLMSLFDLGDAGLPRKLVQQEVTNLLAHGDEDQIRAVLTVARIMIPK